MIHLLERTQGAKNIMMLFRYIRKKSASDVGVIELAIEDPWSHNIPLVIHNACIVFYRGNPDQVVTSILIHDRIRKFIRVSRTGEI
jgi:hypothetical protein